MFFNSPLNIFIYRVTILILSNIRNTKARDEANVPNPFLTEVFRDLIFKFYVGKLN